MTDNVAHSYHEAPAVSEVLPNDLLSRICVRPPYFALRNVRLEGDFLVADAKAELPQGLALGPMRPGDLSRHGAIAGLCALALKQKDDERRYYLASSATFTGCLSQAPYGAQLRFEAEVTSFGKREGSVFITAYNYQERIATLDVTYTILTTSLFERLNAHRRQHTPRVELKPVTVNDISWRGNTGLYQIPTLPVEMCAGHFDDFPAAPVALLMDQLAQIAEQFVDRPSFIAYGQIEADRLCWAGEPVDLSMTKVSGDMLETQLQGMITSAATPVGKMQLLLRHEPN